MTFTPYLHFQGNCAEAMTYYAKVFGAAAPQINRYSDAPPMPGGPPPSDKVMHCELRVGDHALLASDFPDGMPGDAQAAVSVSWSTEDMAQGQAVFDQLADGGAVIMPFAPTFWSKGFGMVKDRFGTHWMVSGPMA